MNILKDKFKDCFDNAFEAGKGETKESYNDLQEQIKELEYDNEDLSDRIEELECEIEDKEDLIADLESKLNNDN